MNIKKGFELLFADVIDFIDNYIVLHLNRRLIIGFIVIFVLTFSALALWLYKRAAHESVMHDLTHLVLKLERSHEDPHVDWGKVEQELLLDQVAYAHAKDSPYSLLLHIDLLLQQRKINEAYELIDAFLLKIPSLPIASFIKALKGVVLLGESSVELRGNGVNVLSDLALQETDVASDYAAYQLGFYYFMQADFKNAKKYWQPLVDRWIMHDKAASVWATKAESYLNQIP